MHLSPKGSLVLHGFQERNLYLGRCSSKVPETKTTSCDWYNTGPIEKLFLKRKQTSSGVAKHAHHLHSGQCLGRVVLNVLLE